LILWASALLTRVDCRRLLFLLADLLVKRWLVNALDLLILPVFVTVNLFATPLLLFNLGIEFNPFSAKQLRNHS
jgi:hypothetical protein